MTLTTKTRLQCYILDTGYCTASERYILRGGAHRLLQMHSLVALFFHPSHGWFLWDTGYASHMLAATQKWPYSLYRRVTPIFLNENLQVTAQLHRWGLQPKDIRTIFISHFHADHISGLRDFPQATIVATLSAYQDIVRRRGFSAMGRAFLPSLLPNDFEKRTLFLPTFSGSVLGTLGPTYDFFGDGTFLLIDLPGHARGQMGALTQTERGPILLAADSCWLRRTIYERLYPSRLTHFFIDDAQALHTTIDNLHAFLTARPEIILLPSHCPEAYAQEVDMLHDPNDHLNASAQEIEISHTTDHYPEAKTCRQVPTHEDSGYPKRIPHETL